MEEKEGNFMFMEYVGVMIHYVEIPVRLPPCIKIYFFLSICIYGESLV